MNYSGLKDAVRAVIKENGNEEITGDILQQTLIAIINALGVGYQFMGVATPDTAFGTPDSRQFYIATAPGTYGSNIVTLDGSKVAILLFADSWNAITLDVPTVAGLSEYLKISDLATSIGTGENTAMTQKATTEAIIAAINTALLKSDVVQSLGDDATKVLSQAAITIVLMGYAKINGVYPELVAGLAQNLVGRGSVLAEITRRTTGENVDVGSGTAQINKFLGKSIVWNSAVKDITDSANLKATGGSTIAYDSTSKSIKVSISGTSSNDAVGIKTTSFVGGHKYAIIINYTGITPAIFKCGSFASVGSTGDTLSNFSSQIWVQVTSSTGDGAFWLWGTVGDLEISSIVIVDLTILGIENIATVAEFKAIYPLPYYAYNPGSIRNNTAIGLKTIGFNQWDEVWEVGTISTTDGTNVALSTTIRSKNYLPVFPGKDYYFRTDFNNSPRIVFYDANKAFISCIFSNVQNRVFTVPDNCHFVRFACYSTYGDTYKHDICINLSWSGYRNGEYEPYWENTLPIPITTMTGKLNGAGDSVTIFPDGMKSVGSVYDETDGTNATKRIGTRAYQSGDENDSSVVTDGTNTNYVLSTPEEYVLDTPLELNYKEDDFGTEQKLPEDTASSVSAPLLIDVQYPMNAVDTLRRLPVNYISKESFDAFCAELATKLGAAIGKTITITSTFNTEQDKYNFTITIV